MLRRYISYSHSLIFCINIVEHPVVSFQLDFKSTVNYMINIYAEHTSAYLKVTT